MRIIPGKTKIRIELFKNVGLADFLIGLVFAGLILLTLTSPIEGRLYFAAGLLFVAVLLLVKIGDEPNYMFFLSMLRHVAYRKKYAKGGKGKEGIENISAFTGIEDGFIVYEDYYGAAIEIPPVEFRFFSQFRRNVAIDDCLGNVLRSLNPNFAANLVKIERKVQYDSYIANENAKLDELRHSYECALISEEEYQAKCEVVFDRLNELETMNTQDKIIAPCYYLVLFDGDRNQLRLQAESAINTLSRGEMHPKRLDSKELALFLKYTNEIDFDEKELDALPESEYASWAMPRSLQIRTNNVILNDITSYTMAISSYPTTAGDAWLAGVMSIPATKVVVKLQPMDKAKTVKNIDRSIAELRARYNASGVDSTLIELANHIQSLTELLSMLQSDNEVLLNTDVYVSCYDTALTKKEGRTEPAENSSRVTINNMRAVVRRLYREEELRLSSLQFNQTEGYIGSQVSGYDPFAKTLGRGIPGATAAAMFPWIYAHVADANGIKLGSEDGIPVFIDMFRRDSERVNSNVVIVGKSGSGKSYAAKSLLVNLAADNSKIFVLDPENEYTELAANLHGKFINVGNAQQGRMNPFQIITALDDDSDEESTATGSYASHMQFLEEFFRQILPDCEKDALEYLNTLADRVYMNLGITEETNLSLLRPEDYPTFDNLYDEILKEFQSTDNEYLRSILRTLMNYVSKFSAGGRNANIWNGPSTISTDENFTVFNFQSLLAGGNSTVTNAQMLLVMKYIDNEIIKNRDYNKRYGTHRKIVVVIDEAHVFIDEKYPIALDFMFQLAKRIRKYNGMQIVITQNIKDFVGSEELSRKSSAIINACQYSFIFPLAPNDMDDLCRLYEKAGGINESEQEKIVTAPRGNAFVILSPGSRSSFQVEVPEDVVRMFQEENLESQYFAGEEGRQAWEEYLGDSREKYLSNLKVKAETEITESAARPARVSLTEISEEEYELSMAAFAPKKVSLTEVAAPEEKIEQKLAAKVSFAEEPAPETVVQQAAIQAVPQVIIKEASDNGEMLQMMNELRRAVESMGSFSYEAMVNDIMSRLGERGAFTQPAAAPVSYAPQPAAPAQPAYKEEEVTAYAAPEIRSEDIYSFESIFNAPEDEPAAGTVSTDDMSLEEYIHMLAEAEPENTAQAEDEKTAGGSFDDPDDGSGFDIMALLEKVASEADNTSILDEMRDSGETVRIITLEELVKLNESRKNI